jgi:NADPH:quinone reductase-like Zn-dependent oxidoreductase
VGRHCRQHRFDLESTPKTKGWVKEKEVAMEAYIVDEPGGKFRKTDLPRPALRPNHVLVRIRASGVNPLDTKVRAGKAAHAKQLLPAVLGLDMAGTIEEVGPNVTALQTR